MTQGQYEAVMGNNPSHFSANGGGKDQVAGESTNRYPVEMVSWLDAILFSNKLSEKEGKKPFYEIDGPDIRVPDWNGQGYRLPTEAEWEFACRANVPTPTCFSFGDNVWELGGYGWFDGNSEERTHPVSQKRRNGFGLYDMHGNVWEWCSDGYDRDYYRRAPGDDPPGASGASYRVLRGGSLHNEPRACRSAIRIGHTPEDRYFNLGFRVALTQPAMAQPVGHRAAGDPAGPHTGVLVPPVRELPGRTQANNIPDHAVRFGTNCYRLYGEVVTWNEAKSKCQALGGHLVTVESEQENTFLHSLLRKSDKDWIWLGATDQEVEGKWVWIDGTAMRYNRWLDGQPNNDAAGGWPENYTAMDRSGFWWDVPDDRFSNSAKYGDQLKSGFVCEWDHIANRSNSN